MLTLDQVLADHSTVDYLDLDIQVIEKLLLIIEIEKLLLIFSDWNS